MFTSIKCFLEWMVLLVLSRVSSFGRGLLLLDIRDVTEKRAPYTRGSLSTRCSTHWRHDCYFLHQFLTSKF